MGKRESKSREQRKYTGSDDDAFKVVKAALSKLGCQPEVVGEDAIDVAFQGENFHIDCEGFYAHIWDPGWSAMKADDPELPKVRDAINRANFTSGPTIVMTAPDEKNYVLIHSRMDIMIHPSIPQVENYVRAVLDTFFQAKETVRNQYQHICVQQQEQQKKRRKIGFCQPEDEEEG